MCQERTAQSPAIQCHGCGRRTDTDATCVVCRRVELAEREASVEVALRIMSAAMQQALAYVSVNDVMAVVAREASARTQAGATSPQDAVTLAAEIFTADAALDEVMV